ncbi:MAG TPA: DNA-processing protein DprA [Bryobacteraceae bacterium]|nr:DNA-processing protein DprA [Bryobacteraceae bacterium]
MAAHAFSFQERAISPWAEMGAYEALWDQDGVWFNSLAEKFAAHPGSLPSDFVLDSQIRELYANKTLSILKRAGIDRFGVRINGAGEYPLQLRNAEHPIEMLYYQGNWDLVETRCIAIVGTRNPSPAGIKTTAKIAARLSDDGFTVVSGLAGGIDTTAHGAAIQRGRPTIAVIGMPLSQPYPKENAGLQRFIAKENLLISQVPVCRYQRLHYKVKPRFFPERNVTMSALTEATIIVEAGNTSGTLIQARAALKQGRKLLILESCFKNDALTWPSYYEKRGAVRVKNYHDIARHLA